ncbi:CDP-alcohol phosphatidyltransferase [Treponema vincentii]|uniref:CDP-alcohol phosphatidyltransferase family protein n=1 Tax=Treponema TaxID=157 RepID=UPI001BAF47B7|nr:CDP-alcohol phosphatidyltransferase family protein [Treponema vincentii]QUY17168.1 CDP-alcohol phosphatidyltransferase [Treponema vincentii]
MTEYSYSADDQSILSPVLYKFFVNPLVKILPYRLPANFITFFSFLSIIIAFCISVHGYYIGRYEHWWLIPLLALIYLTGDCADGKQARKTGTGSPLGEYFDHFLDCFVTGLLMGILMISFRVTKPALITIGFFNLYAGQIGSFWERYKRRVMCFGKLGSNEGIIAIGLTSWLMSIPSIHTAADAVLIFNITGGEALIIIIMTGTAISAIHSIVRSRAISSRLITHLILSFTVTYTAAYLFGNSNMVYITGVVSFYNVFFLASLLAATNLGSRECLPDIIIPLSFVLFFLIPNYTSLIQHLQIVYLAIRVGIKFAAFVKINRRYWYWINPPPPSEGLSTTR